MSHLLKLWIVRLGLLGLAGLLVLTTFNLAGPRSAFLLCVGLCFGMILEGFRFGFAGPWRAMLAERDGRGLLTQFLAIGLTALVAFPLLAANPDELTGAYAPVGIAMLGGAFVFGAAMQLVAGCGSGTLVNAGSGNLIGLLALIGFIGGSFLGSLHLAWWTELGTLPLLTLQGMFGAGGGLAVTLLGLAALALVTAGRAAPGKRLPPPRLLIAAVLLAVVATLNLVIAGQPWGVVYGLGLWGAKLAQFGGMDVAATGFWATAAHGERLQQSVLTDVTSLTNFGLILGAFLVMRWRRVTAAQTANLSLQSWGVILLAGLVLGYSARIAFGCNVGAFFSGVATGSLHGWVWFLAAFAGSALGLRLRGLWLKPAMVPAPVVVL
ncbi:MAG: hypothetical protein RLZZ385_1869 [Pseudomonadota bacterium]